MGAIVVPPLDVVLTVGNSASKRIEFSEQATQSTDTVGTDAVTIASGQSAWQPGLNIPLSATWTVDAGGTLETTRLVVDGTLTVNGTSRVL